MGFYHINTPYLAGWSRVNIMPVDALATDVARASADMILTLLDCQQMMLLLSARYDHSVWDYTYSPELKTDDCIEITFLVPKPQYSRIARLIPLLLLMPWLLHCQDTNNHDTDCEGQTYDLASSSMDDFNNMCHLSVEKCYKIQIFLYVYYKKTKN